VILSTAQSLIAVFGIGTGSVAVGGLLLRDGVRWLNEAVERRRAPSTPGRIISSRLAPRDVPADDGSYSRTWNLEVVFEYQVKGRVLRGTCTTVFASYLSAVRQERKHAVGAAVRVLFDRTEPESAVLDPRLTLWRPWVYIIAGAACVIGGVLALTRLAAS
jgi:Protein of unknown function (DUF3592)